MSTATAATFKDPTALAKWTRGVLYVLLIGDIAMLVSAAMEYQLLSSYESGAFASDSSEFERLAVSNDLRQQVIGVAWFVVFCVAVVSFAKFIYRASHNLRSLGAADLRFTPGWAIGWYFIPFANLWKPYQAMKEIWNASSDPVSWKTNGSNPLLVWWWFFWITSNIVSQISFRMWRYAESVDDYLRSDIADMVAQLFSIPLDLLAIALIGRITAAQMASYTNARLVAAFEG